MNLKIVLEDQEEMHREANIEIKDDASIDQLMERITEELQIEKNYQRLYVKGTQLLFDTAGVEDKGTVIVRHSRLPTWKAYREVAATFKEMRNDEEPKKWTYDILQQFAKDLNDTGLYRAYPKFTEGGVEIAKMLFAFYDRTRGAIQNSTKMFFERLYLDRNPTIKFESRLEGSRRGCVCFVEMEGTTIKYHVKTHHGGGDRGSHAREDQDLDIKELFAYKILQKLGAGAEIEYVPNEIGSRWFLYIASRDIPGFRTIQEIESDEAESGDLSNYKRAVVQMLFLYSVLNMVDHHWKNMGVDGNGSPFIVDFFVIERGSIDVKEDFYHQVRHADKISGVLGTLEERLKMAKEYLKESNFVSKVEETLESFLLENKKLFDENQLYFKNANKTDDLKLYVQKIKNNVSKFEEFQL